MLYSGFPQVGGYRPGFQPMSAHDTAVPAGPARLPVPQPSADQLGTLTPREREVLTSIAEGCSTKQIAARLGITFKTAAFHRYKIMQKLDVHETSTLVRFAIRCGLIQP